MVANKGISIWLIGALTILLGISGPWFDLSVSNHSFVKTYIAGIGIGVLVLLTIWQKNYSEQRIHLSYIKLFLGITFLMGLLSIAWSVNPDFSITKILIWVTILMAAYVTYNIDLTEDTIIKLCLWLLAAATIIALIGILQYLFDAFRITQAAIPSSTFGNKNMATQPLSMIFPLAVFVILSKRLTNTQVWISTICTALLLTFIFYTSTRAAWLAIIGEIILITLFLIWQRKHFSAWANINKEKIAALISSAVLLLILINFNGDGFYPFWEKVVANVERLTESATNSRDLRIQIWTVALTMINDAPLFGTGIGTWFHNLVNEGYATYVINYVQRVHNDILEMAVSIGLVGVSFFLLGVIALVVALWKIILSSEHKTRAVFFFALFTALSGSFVNLQFSFPYQLAMPALLFGLYVGVIARESEQYIKPVKEWVIKTKKQSLHRYKHIILGINVIVFVVITSLYMSWIGVYSGLNKINMTGSFDKLSLVEVPVYHLETQNILNFLTSSYMKSGNKDIAEKVVKQMLKYWPNDIVTNARYVSILAQKKQYNKALRYVQKVQEIAPVNFMFHNIVAFNIYFQQKQYDKYIALFEQLRTIPEAKLSLNPSSYSDLTANALRVQALWKYVPELYEKHHKYNGYNCTLENNMLYYYFATGDNVGLKKQYTKEVNKANNCLNPTIVNQVKSKLNLP